MQAQLKTVLWLNQMNFKFVFQSWLGCGVNAFSSIYAEHAPCINKSTGSFICLFISIVSVSAAHSATNNLNFRGKR